MQKAFKILERQDHEKDTLYHIIAKILSTLNKEKLLKSTREKA